MRLPEPSLPVVATLALALALAVGHAAGSSEDAQSGPIAEPVSRGAAGRDGAAAEQLAMLRPRRAAAAEEVRNIFDGRSWVPAPPPPPPAPTPAPVPVAAPRPTAPPLPFTYLGRLEDEAARPVAYLQRGERLVAASPGDEVDGDYRLETMSPEEIVLTFLPLGQRQALRIRRDTP